MANANKTPGLLDKITSHVGSLGANPLFGLGMGLLQSRYDARINPFEAGMEGILSATQEKRTQEQQARDEEQRQALMDFFQSGQFGGQAPPPPYSGAQSRLDQLQGPMSPAPGFYNPQMSAAPQANIPAAMMASAPQQYNMMPATASQPFVSSLPQPMGDFSRRMALDIALRNRR